MLPGNSSSRNTEIGEGNKRTFIVSKLKHMAITEERLRQTFSEGGAQEIYQEVKASSDFLGFARQYAFSQDYCVARSALWGLTKANISELSQLQPTRVYAGREIKIRTF